jgi:hypothetical protein
MGNRQFPHIVEALSGLPDATIVDGEVLALDGSGRPDFNLLQNFRAEASRIHYFVFDLLVHQNRDLTHLPLSERGELMRSLLKFRSPPKRTGSNFEREGEVGSPARFELATLRLTAVNLISSQVAGVELNRGKSASSDQIGLVGFSFSFLLLFAFCNFSRRSYDTYMTLADPRSDA